MAYKYKYLFDTETGEFHEVPEKMEHTKKYQPISGARVSLVVNAQKRMFRKLIKHQNKGDNWRKEDFYDLQTRLDEEMNELCRELHKIMLDRPDASFEKAQDECADVMNVAAMIMEKLRGLEEDGSELDQIWKSADKE